MNKSTYFKICLPQCLHETIRLLDLVCKIDDGQVARIYQEIKRQHNRLSQDHSKARFLLPVLQFFLNHSKFSGAVMVLIIWQLDLQLPVQAVPITTKVGNSNPVHGEVYSIQHYVIKFVSDLRQVGGFLWILRFPPPIKLTATI